MKICFKCEVRKPFEDFYSHPQMADGHVNKCKECNKVDVQNNYRRRKKRYKTYERLRQKDPERRAKKLLYQSTYRTKNRDKYLARRKVQYMLCSGKLERLPCKHCGKKKTEAHHKDYSKPLDVVWVCRKCHREVEHGIK